MFMGLCCCGFLETCTQCRTKTSAVVDMTNLTLTFGTAPDVGVTPGSDTFTYTIACTFPCLSRSDTTEDQTQLTLDSPPQTLQLRQRGLQAGALQTGYGYDSTSGVCQWLWNDVRGYKIVWHSGNYDINDGGIFVPDADYKHTWVPGVHEIIEEYTPVNAIDSTSPWNRVESDPSDSRIGTCFITPPAMGGCTTNYKWNSHYSRVYSSLCLTIKRGHPPYSQTVSPSCSDPYDVLFKENTNTETPGQMFWVLTSFHDVTRYVQYYGSTFLDGGLAPDYTRYYDVVKPAVTTQIRAGSIGGWNNARPSGSYGPTQTGFPSAASGYVWAKTIDCETDFNGDPIVLELSHRLNECGNNQYFPWAAVPETVEITIDDLV